MVDEYEIELRLQHRGTGEVTHSLLTVYAYRVSDVPVQALYMVFKERDPEEWDSKVLSSVLRSGSWSWRPRRSG